MVKVTLIGTSGLLPVPDRALSAALLECGGHSVLFDCGEGTQTAARRTGCSLMKTDIIALTHYHGDHIFGLPGLMQTMFSMERSKPLYITGPEGLRNVMRPMLELTGELPFDVIPVEINGGLRPADIIKGFPPEARITPFETKHRVKSCGYVFTLDRAGRFDPQSAKSLGIPMELWGRLQRGETVEADGRRFSPEQVTGKARRGIKIVFTGDTAPCDSLTDAAQDADLLIADATYAEDEHLPLASERGHMTFSQAAQCAAQAGVRELWLTHYSQRIKEPEMYIPVVRNIFPGTVCGRDGMCRVINFGE